MPEYEYDILINPRNLFHNWYEVRAFCDLSNNVEELRAFQVECEKEEMYEYCRIIQNRIDVINCYRNLGLPMV